MNPVKARRLEMGMTQQTLAHDAGLSLRTVQNVEGSLDLKLSTLLAVARALDTTPELLMYQPVAA